MTDALSVLLLSDGRLSGLLCGSVGVFSFQMLPEREVPTNAAAAE